MGFHVVQLVPIASCPGHYWEALVSPFFILSHQVFINIDKTPLILVFSGLNISSYMKDAPVP